MNSTTADVAGHVRCLNGNVGNCSRANAKQESAGVRLCLLVETLILQLTIDTQRHLCDVYDLLSDPVSRKVARWKRVSAGFNMIVQLRDVQISFGCLPFAVHSWFVAHRAIRLRNTRSGLDLGRHLRRCITNIDLCHGDVELPTVKRQGLGETVHSCLCCCVRRREWAWSMGADASVDDDTPALWLLLLHVSEGLARA